MPITPKKKSFFDRLSGGSSSEYDDFDDMDLRPSARQSITAMSSPSSIPTAQAITAPVHAVDDEPMEGQLPVDVYQTANEIVVRAFVAGVRPDELSLSISRDMVVVEGSRESREQISEPDYFSRELFWGSFTRTILLPQEIDVDNATAASKDGLLTIILPKLDKARQTKLKVRAG